MGWLQRSSGPLTAAHKQVVTTLELAGVEAFVQDWPGLPGRPPCDRAAQIKGKKRHILVARSNDSVATLPVPVKLKGSSRFLVGRFEHFFIVRASSQ